MSPRDMGAADKSAAPKASAPNQFDPLSVLAQQQRIAEALVASGQKFLEGLQEIARRSALLQTALFQQALAGFATGMPGVGSTEHGDDAVTRASAAAEATVASLRDVMQAACKCHTDVLATFQQRMAGTDAACGNPRRQA